MNTHNHIAAGLGAASVACVLLTLPAQSNPPGLTIRETAPSEFEIVVTNAVATTNYTLFWTDILADVNYPWIPMWVGEIGQSNFVVPVPDPENYPQSFFKVLEGSDSDGDGVFEQVDADSNDPSVGILTISINAPAHGSILD
ncbi:MAG TPA: hypothetical protein VEH04_01710 [Verrucomicrobiae bacterium]|nr:hypothetical protein [Verrucomicrobiae bacterium]